MNTRLVQVGLCLLAAAGVAGCTSFQQTLTGEETVLPGKNPEDVKVYLSSQALPHPYKEVGTIVTTLSSENDAVSFLKEKAAAMGADALMNLEVRVHTSTLVIIIIPIPVHHYIASAIAVKYTSEN